MKILEARARFLRVGVRGDEQIPRVVLNFEETGEELLEVPPLVGHPRDGRAESSSGARLEREPEDERREATERDRILAPNQISEIAFVRVVASEVGLELGPMS